ncbi:uncharacterized protein [Lepeophtheirus salmonis]|uniref:uncharacterized protein n=1 Tax=Lepeophtheirus salmonis TaxID=72036 RepID=UPI003AF3A7F1
MCPMGLKCAQDISDCVGDEAFERLENVEELRTDIIVSSRNMECHFKYVKERISRYGIATDDKKIKAIQEYLTPRNIIELRRFLCMDNQLGGFVKELGMNTIPIRGLLRKHAQFILNPNHEEKETRLLTDASRNYGLEFVLQQKHGEDWNLIKAGSRFIYETKYSYAMVGLELFGVAFAMKEL